MQVTETWNYNIQISTAIPDSLLVVCIIIYITKQVKQFFILSNNVAISHMSMLNIPI